MRSANLRAVLVGMVVAATPVPALAFENFDQGKSSQQIFASDCAICHHSASGLGAKMGPGGLASFLSEHYTASRDVANALAGYLAGQGETAAPRPDGRRTRVSSQREEAGKAAARKPASSKSDTAKSDSGKPASARRATRSHKTKPPAAPTTAAKPSAGSSSPDVTGSTSKPATSEKGN